MLLLLILGFSAQSFARGSSSGGVLLNVNAYMYNYSSKTEPGGSTADGSSSIYDVKLGYLSNDWYYGLLMTSRNEDPLGNGSKSGSAMGAGAGYFFGEGFFLMAHYILSATYNDDLKKGTGFQFDFGYLTNVSSNFQVGVELTRRDITYKEHKTIASLDSFELVETFPMLTFGFIF